MFVLNVTSVRLWSFSLLSTDRCNGFVSYIAYFTSQRYTIPELLI